MKQLHIWTFVLLLAMTILGCTGCNDSSVVQETMLVTDAGIMETAFSSASPSPIVLQSQGPRPSIPATDAAEAGEKAIASVNLSPTSKPTPSASASTSSPTPSPTPTPTATATLRPSPTASPQTSIVIVPGGVVSASAAPSVSPTTVATAEPTKGITKDDFDLTFDVNKARSDALRAIIDAKRDEGLPIEGIRFDDDLNSKAQQRAEAMAAQQKAEHLGGGGNSEDVGELTGMPAVYNRAYHTIKHTSDLREKTVYGYGIAQGADGMLYYSFIGLLE